MKSIRWISAGAVAGGLLLLSGCVAVPGSYGYDNNYYSQPAYGGGYYSEPAPVVVAPSVYLQGGSYYDRGYNRGYYEGRPRGYDRPRYDDRRPDRAPRPGVGPRPDNGRPGPGPRSTESRRAQELRDMPAALGGPGRQARPSSNEAP